MNNNYCETDLNLEISKNTEKVNILKNIYTNNEKMMSDIRLCKTPNDLRLYNLMLIKNYVYDEKIFGLMHIQVRYFQKEKNYDKYISLVQVKINESLQISEANTGISRIFVLLDLNNITQKNFSKKFLKLMGKELNKGEEETLLKCYVIGNIKILKVFWPLVKMVVEKETRDKLVLLK